MTAESNSSSRWRLLRDVVAFQIKLALEAIIDLALIPLSLAAAGLDLVLGNWRRPRWFHRVLRFGERCERRIDLWGAGLAGETDPESEIDAIVRGVEVLLRQPSTTPGKIRELRRWAAAKLAPGGDDLPPPSVRSGDPAG